MNISVIDIGSNTVKIGVYNIHTDNTFELLSYRDEYIGLYSHIKDGDLDIEGFDSLCDVLNSYEEFSKQYCAENIFAFATAALRSVRNKQKLIEAVEDATGIRVRIISGEEESHCDYLAVRNIAGNDFIMIDLGGGSVQIIISQNSEATYSISLPLGSLRMYEEFSSSQIINPKDGEKIRAHVLKSLKDCGVPKMATEKIYAMSGTARTFRKLCTSLNGECGSCLSRSEANIVYSKILMSGKDGVSALVRVAGDRAKTLFPGMFVILGICEYFGSDFFEVVYSTIKEGFLTNLLQENKMI